jgi:hypothetical protein
LRTEKYATVEASRSMLEWTASVMIAIEPVTAPAAIFRTIRTELETMESAAARCLRGVWAAGPMARAGACAAASARPPRFCSSGALRSAPPP